MLRLLVYCLNAALFMQITIIEYEADLCSSHQLVMRIMMNHVYVGHVLQATYICTFCEVVFQTISCIYPGAMYCYHNAG